MAPTRTGSTEQFTLRLPHDVAAEVNTWLDKAEEAGGVRPAMTAALIALIREALEVRAAAPELRHEARVRVLTDSVAPKRSRKG